MPEGSNQGAQSRLQPHGQVPLSRTHRSEHVRKGPDGDANLSHPGRSHDLPRVLGGVSSPTRVAPPKQSPSRGPSRQRGWMSALRRAARRHPESGSPRASLRRACRRVFRQSRVHPSTPPRSLFWSNQPSGCRSFRWLDLGDDAEMLCTSSLSLPGTISGSEPSAPRGSRQAPVTL